ncbi:cyclopropane fatty acyl phospholipid synthase [Puniceicoccales bacterium CK1056]|uniref:Cyclopropane fatty acyl phospholipid synthase n=1 Tax=Oceanipulchritudo coccoides TaxID=2706888 RepID=A0A6B2M2B7_9BACT|nr:cyclopropane fatty acyl phospholipid synthase [Oceanipulchritudo coccoides]
MRRKFRYTSHVVKQQLLDVLNGAGIEVNGDQPWDIQVLDERFWRRVALTRGIGFGDAYVDGWWTSKAVDELVNRLLRHSRTVARGHFLHQLWGSLVCQIFNLQRLSRAFQVGERHYDIGNGLYRRMLGESMVYSCGYWDGGAATLEDAQRDKLELICRKIQLQPGMKVLDIGCGWGSFCKYAAENYQAEVVGVTVSRQQVAVAREACADLPVEIRLEDYRSLIGCFDRIVSIGMFEHVGPKNYRTFMDVARRNLDPEGLFLLHTIGSNQSYGNSYTWLTRHIFPNGHIPSIAQIGRSIEEKFVMEDLHNFGVNYDRTLMEWEARFRKAWPEIRRGSHMYDDRFYRMWRYYLLSCAGAFRARHVQLWQWVLSPKGLTAGYKRPAFSALT